jgi:sugar/nucleoside kinase (ribokinase family)
MTFYFFYQNIAFKIINPMSSITVVGTVAFDAIETPFGKTDKIIGGAATYISLAASYFTKKINLVSVVGGDFPKQQIALMQSKGINVDGLEILENEKTFFWSGKYHLDMNTRDTLATELNVLSSFQPKLPDAYKNPEFLMLGNLMPSVQMMVLKQMTKRPKLIVMDTMNFWMESSRPELDEVMKMVDVLTINDAEARELSNEYSLVKAAKKILAMGPKYLIIKKGEHGALLFNDKNVFFAPALPLEEVFDPTGAGDTFAGGFIGYLASANDISFDSLKRAIIYGSAMASFCVEKFGIERLLNLTHSEIEERIQEFVDLVQFDISLVE